MPLCKLTQRAYERALTKPGRYSDGGGLFLEVRGKNKAARWTYQYSRAGKVRWIGVGPVYSYDLNEARQKHSELRKLVGRGIDPNPVPKGTAAHPGRRNLISRGPAIIERSETPSPFLSFAEEAERFIGIKSKPGKDAKGNATPPDWKPEEIRDHRARLTKYAIPRLANLHVDQITVGDIVAVLEPIWNGSPDSVGGKLRKLLERIFDAVHTPHDLPLNPASWAKLSTRMKNDAPEQKHHACMKVAAVPAFYADLNAENKPRSRAIQVLILTGCRKSEVLEANWKDFDLVENVWTIPATQRGRKNREPHTVPLNDEIKRLLGTPGAGKVFGRGTSKTTLENCFKAHGLHKVVTPHGFRTTIQSFASDVLHNEHADTKELLIGHKLKGVKEPYRGWTLLQKRREIVDQWTRWCTGQPLAAPIDWNAAVVNGK
jgi:hypothetical protein